MEKEYRDTNKFKNILCETMKAFIAFCEDNGLHYYASYGTCLGAIRHKGIIPWDDDIDVLMPRKDYNKFLKLKNSLLGTSYRIVDSSDDGYYLSFAKFVNVNTTILESLEFPFLLGVFVDVFPLDDVGNVVTARQLSDEKNKVWFQYRDSLLHFVPSTFCNYVLRFKVKTAFHYLINAVLGRFHSKKLYDKFLDVDKTIQQQQGNKCMFYGGWYSFDKELCKKEWFGEGVSVPFEDFSIVVPIKYDAYLSHIYKDYMTPPPIEQQVSHHDQYFVDLTKRFSVKEIYGLKLKKQEKKVYKYE